VFNLALFLLFLAAQYSFGHFCLVRLFQVRNERLIYLSHFLGFTSTVLIISFGFLAGLSFWLVLIPVALGGVHLIVGGIKMLRIDFLSLLLLVICGAPILIQSLLMGIPGEYPPFFSNVDTPFSLSVMESLVRADSYPPALRDNLNSSSPYHYGAYMYGAFLMKLTGMAAYKVYTLLLMPYLLFLAINALFFTMKNVIGKQVYWSFIATFMVWFSFQQYVYNVFNWETLVNLTTSSGYYWSIYPKALNFLPFVFVLAVLGLLIEKKSTRNYVLAAFFVGITPYFKLTLAPYLLAGFAAFFLIESIAKRNYNLLIFPFISLLIFLGIHFSFTAGGVASVELSLGITRVSRHFIFSFILPIVVGLVVLVSSRGMSFKHLSPYVKWLAFIVALPLVFLLVEVQHKDAWQMFVVAPFAAWFLLVAYVLKQWHMLTARLKTIFMVFMAGVMFLPLLSFTYFNAHVVNNPEIALDYCDNVALAETLKKVPAQETILATNDLRYPADQYHRKGIQTQLSGLFGHQMWISNLNYLISEDKKEWATEMTKEFAVQKLSKQQLQRLDNLGVTHFIMAHIDSAQAGYPVAKYSVVVVPSGE
jgi:hypothetical protein